MPDEEQPEVIRADMIEERFSDVFWTSISPWACAITFGIRPVMLNEEEQFPRLRVRMSLEQAKALAIMLLRNIRVYETETNIDIDIPDALLEDLNIPREDWERFKPV